MRERVFLLHGIGAGVWMMSPLAKRLIAAGYEVHNWGYPSIWRGIEDHGRRLADVLRAAEAADPGVRIHFVAHSMGSIVARDALARFTPANLGRLVFLGPPNRGSPVATFFGPWLRRVCRPIDQLAAREDSYVNCLSPLHGVEFGVIAASLDWLVPVASTHLDGEREHLVIKAMHSQLLVHDDVAKCVCRFLASGSFSSHHTPCDDNSTRNAI
jgi:pimeloyl-ACP methyl ester carboxylesterase